MLGRGPLAAPCSSNILPIYTQPLDLTHPSSFSLGLNLGLWAVVELEIAFARWHQF